MTAIKNSELARGKRRRDDVVTLSGVNAA